METLFTCRARLQRGEEGEAGGGIGPGGDAEPLRGDRVLHSAAEQPTNAGLGTTG